MAQSRGYNSTKHSALPYVDKEYKLLLDKIAYKTEWSKKLCTEKAILGMAVSLGLK